MNLDILLLRLSRFPLWRAVEYWRQQGLAALFDRAFAKLKRETPVSGADAFYHRWTERHQRLSWLDRRRIKRHIARMPSPPVVSIRLYGDGPKERSLASLRAQLYQHWELDAERAEWVGYLRNGDQLSPHAIYMMVTAALANPGCALIYSDEDVLAADGARSHPYFKPDWNRELFLSRSYIDKFCLIRRDLAPEGWPTPDLLRPIVEGQVIHVPEPLYHAARYETVEARRVHYPLPDPKPLVSVIIPTRDRLNLLRNCVDGLLDKTDYPALEIIIVDNDSAQSETVAYFREMTERGVKVLKYSGEFNFSAMNNLAAREAKGSVLAFLNNDIEIIEENWLTEMVGHALRPDVGAVGAKLYFPDDTIQHAGVVLGLFRMAGHVYHHLPRTTPGNADELLLCREVSAVTAACMVARRDLFLEVGGFDAIDLKVAFNDVDLCLKMRAAGYRIIWTPYAELYHHESATRGSELDPENISREKHERRVMRQRWGAKLDRDPFYNPNLSVTNAWCTLANRPRTIKPWRLNG